MQAKGSCSAPLAASSRPSANLTAKVLPGENVVLAESEAERANVRAYAVQLYMEKGCALWSLVI